MANIVIQERFIYTSQNSITPNPKTTTGHPGKGSTLVQERGVIIWVLLCSHQKEAIIAKERYIRETT